jgi:RND family efflux transporter MFP subunit
MPLRNRLTSIYAWLPSRTWLFLPPLLLGVGVVVALASSKKKLPRAEYVRTAVPVKVVKVHRSEVYPEVVGFGTAVACRTWSATAEVDGRITKLHPRLRSGVFVEAGEVLLEIDRTDYQRRVEQREAELLQARAKLERMKLTCAADQASLKIQEQLLSVRKNNVDRLTKLRTSAAASPSEHDAEMAIYLQQSQTVQNLASTLATYPAQIAEAEAAVTLAESRIREAERDVNRTTITAPFDGTLADASLELEQYVQPNQPLFDVIDTAAVEIEAQFSLAQLSRIARPASHLYDQRSPADQPTQMLVATSPDTNRFLNVAPEYPNWFEHLTAVVAVHSGDVELSYPAKVVRLSESVDEQTRTIGVVIRVENANSGSQSFPLRPGTYCEVLLSTDLPIEACVIPRTCLDGDEVLVVDDENVLRREEVVVDVSLRDMVALASGLDEGDCVVVNPSTIFREGDLVEPQLENFETGTAAIAGRQNNMRGDRDD